MELPGSRCRRLSRKALFCLHAGEVSSSTPDLPDGPLLKRTTQREESNLCDRLWNLTKEWREKALHTKFIQGLKGGMLDPSDFGSFMIQDSVYCYKAKKAFDIASEVATGDLQAFLVKQSEDYTEYYTDLYKEWHIKNASGIDLNEACQNYIDELTKAAAKPFLFVAANIPCERLWPWIGQQLGVDPDPNKDTNKFGCYTSFLKSYFDPNSDDYKKLERKVNDAFRMNEVTAKEILNVYSTSMQCEVAFFASVTKD